MPDDRAAIIAYHEATKHHYQRFAAGPDGLDWANQPEPFRRYAGAPLVALEQFDDDDGSPSTLTFADAVADRLGPAQDLDAVALSRFFWHGLALSAWKQVAASCWSLRVNPSSGNLHPTECYLICGPVAGLWSTPVVAHYAPREHGLEIRATPDTKLWADFGAGLAPGSFLLVLTSVPWREEWKYGERAFRYCQHDVGHAIGALSYAAALCGWNVTLADELGDEKLGALCGLDQEWSAEPEQPDCLLVVEPGPALPGAARALKLPPRWAELEWTGEANLLSPRRREWPLVAEAVAATAADGAAATSTAAEPSAPETPAPTLVGSDVDLARVIRGRRSAVQMDGETATDRYTFFGILGCLIPGKQRRPFATLPWRPRSDLIIFVHRVAGLVPGIYIMLRDPGRRGELAGLMRSEFIWKAVPDCPEDLDLHLLMEGEVRDLARALSCMQDIAGDGCFSLGMLSAFGPVLERHGAWVYRRLFWECGLIGQALYLAAEASGLRGTGIGCYFDDSVHEVLGLQGNEYQSLYHFTVGGAVDDDRLSNLPAYPAPDG